MKKGLFALFIAILGLTSCNPTPSTPEYSVPFVPDVYKLKFDYNFPNSPEPVTGTCTEGELITVTPPTMPTRENWTALNTWSLSPAGSFDTWDLSTRRVQDEDAINGTVTLYAMWDMDVLPEPPEPEKVLANIKLNLNGVWNRPDTYYAAWTWKDGGNGKWTILDQESDNIWVLPDFDYPNNNLLFAAFPTSSTTPDWEKVVYQTNDLKVPEDTYFEYVITSAGSGSTTKASGKWVNGEGEDAPDVPVTPGASTTLYLDLNGTSNWQSSNAKFALWAWRTGAEGSWLYMTPVNEQIWKIENFDYVTYNFLFVSYSNTLTTPDWSSVFHQTNDLSITDDTFNCYKITSPGTGTSLKASGTWTTYTEA